MTAPAWLADDDAVRAVRDRIQQVNEQDYPIRVATLPEDALTDEEIAKVTRAMDGLAAGAPPEWRSAPPGPRWAPEEIRDFLAENVTVVAPGETLVIRARDDWTPNQVREVQESLNAALEHGSISFRCLVVPGAELGKASESGAGNEPPPDSLDNFWSLPAGCLHWPTRATAPTMPALCERLAADGVLTGEQARSLSGMRPPRTWFGAVQDAAL